MNLVLSPMCTFCGDHKETLEHLLISCTNNKNFWLSVTSGFQKGSEGFQSVSKGFQSVSKGFQSVSKGFQKGFKAFPRGFRGTSNPLENAFVDKTCFRMKGHKHLQYEN